MTYIFINERLKDNPLSLFSVFPRRDLHCARLFFVHQLIIIGNADPSGAL